MGAPIDPQPVTVPDFLSARSRGTKLTMLTAYDYVMAKLADDAGVDSILVGDSLGMIVQGQPNSLSVTLDEVLYHTRCVAKAVRRALLIADMPFMSYHLSPEQALANAGRLVKEAGAHSVKLEGGVRMAAAIEKIVKADIPVVGHVGLTPQSLRMLGGFRVQRDEKVLQEAQAVAQAGAFAVVLECVPADLAARVTAALPVPTIGIGAGAGCDGQVLVLQDMLGLFEDLQPKFVKHYVDLGSAVKDAIRRYCSDVRAGTFPGKEHEFK